MAQLSHEWNTPIINVNDDRSLNPGALEAQASMLELFGTMDWDETFDYKVERSR